MRIVVELTLNTAHYISPSYLASGSSANGATLLEYLMQDVEIPFSEGLTHLKVLQAETVNVYKPSTDFNMCGVYAAADILKVPLTSVHPDKGEVYKRMLAKRTICPTQNPAPEINLATKATKSAPGINLATKATKSALEINLATKAIMSALKMNLTTKATMSALKMDLTTKATMSALYKSAAFIDLRRSIVFFLKACRKKSQLICVCILWKIWPEAEKRRYIAISITT